jgi:hypothetical protein
MKYLLIVLSMAFSLSVNAQISLKGATIRGAVIGTTNAASGGGGGGSAYTFITSASAVEADSGSSALTTAKNTTGATFIILAVANYSSEADGGYTTAVTDSKGNTWTALPECIPGGGQRHCVRMFYCFSPTTDASHTFHVTVGSYPQIAMIAFSGGGSHTVDTSTCAASGTTTPQPGAISAATDELLITAGCAASGLGFSSIDSSFTLQENVPTSPNGGNSMALAYYSVPSAASKNPTWTVAANNGVVTMTGFK